VSVRGGRPVDVRASERGVAALDYLAIVAVIALLVAGLLVVREQVASRQAPVRPLPGLVRLLGRVGEVLDPHRPHRPRPARPRRPRPRPDPVIVRLPPWLLR
jgi:hypothetical protein